MNSSEHEPVNTFIIPHYKSPTLKRCLETLWARTPHNFRVIVVSQNPEYIYPQIKDYVHVFIQSYRQLGFAKACNTGWRLAQTPYVTICNDDVEFVHPSWWDGVVKGFEDKTVIGVNPKSARQYTIGVNIGDKLPYKETWTEEEYHQMLALPFTSLQCQAMFCTTFRQDLAQRVGYFDEYFYPAGGEDIDWLIRAKGLRETANRFRGYSVISTPHSYVWHWWNQSNQDPTFIQARIQLRKKWGENFDMSSATTTRVIPKTITKEL